MVIYLSILLGPVRIWKNGTMADTMVRVPKALQDRYERLENSDSWKSFPAFVREAIRHALDRHENLERSNTD